MKEDKHEDGPVLCVRPIRTYTRNARTHVIAIRRAVGSDGRTTNVIKTRYFTDCIDKDSVDSAAPPESPTRKKDQPMRVFESKHERLTPWPVSLLPSLHFL